MNKNKLRSIFTILLISIGFMLSAQPGGGGGGQGQGGPPPGGTGAPLDSNVAVLLLVLAVSAYTSVKLRNKELASKTQAEKIKG